MHSERENRHLAALTRTAGSRVGAAHTHTHTHTRRGTREVAATCFTAACLHTSVCLYCPVPSCETRRAHGARCRIQLPTFRGSSEAGRKEGGGAWLRLVVGGHSAACNLTIEGESRHMDPSPCELHPYNTSSPIRVLSLSVEPNVDLPSR